MSDLIKSWLWVTAGMYFAVAGVGGSSIGPLAALACGWFAGKFDERASSIGGRQ